MGTAQPLKFDRIVANRTDARVQRDVQAFMCTVLSATNVLLGFSTEYDKPSSAANQFNPGGSRNLRRQLLEVLLSSTDTGSLGKPANWPPCIREQRHAAVTKELLAQLEKLTDEET